jgi:hypothetical protein
MRMFCIVLYMLSSMPAMAYRLVNEEGAPFKWGSSQLGTGAVITYSFAREPIVLQRGFDRAECDAIESPEVMLARSSIAVAAFEAEVRRGIERWTQVADVRFLAVDDPREADVVIGAQIHPRGTAFVNVRVANDGAVRTAEKAIVCINPQHVLTVRSGDCATRFNIAYLLSHEFGHVLGLDHPAPVGSLMSFRCSEDQQLNDDDAAGARYLYGPAR